ncbi:MAG: cation diffusion facilitator family transporter [bacterium]|nr:cation diffusion facilitator family transporter [bacterium]
MTNDFTVRSSSQSRYTREIRRITWIGLIINFFLALAKLAGGTIGHSQAVVADAVHSLSDCTTDIAILIGVQYWSRPPDTDHPYGHRRIETIVTIIIALALALVAAGLSWQAFTTMHKNHLGPPGMVAFIAAVGSIIVKELMFRYTATVAKRVQSTALLANAWHHRSDSLSSVPAALAVAGAYLMPDWAFLDHVGAVVVSLFILQAAWRIGWPAIKQLVDVGAPGDIQERISEIVLGIPGVTQVHAIRTRYIGSGLQVDLHVLVDGAMTVRDGHDISMTVKQSLITAGPGIVDVVVHLEPDDHPFQDDTSEFPNERKGR